MNHIQGAGELDASTQQDVVIALLNQVRTEQLCSFVAEMAAVRRMAGANYNPVIVSRMQAEAIEEFLVELGYGVFGKGSGPMATVSTDPQVRKAA